MPECFVIMPLTTPLGTVERYGGDPDHFAHVFDCLFAPAILVGDEHTKTTRCGASSG